MPRPRLDLALVLVTGIGHYVFRHLLGLAAPFIALVVAFWVPYVALRLRTPGQADAWGLRRANLAPALRETLAFMAVAGALMVAYGVLARGAGVPSAGFFALLALYPLFGLVQQLLVCAVGGTALEALTGRRAVAIAIGAAIFGVIHAPDLRLVALTTAAGAVWMTCFFRWRNLWPLGLAHGWLGAIAYFYVLGRDPWVELRASLERAGVL
jgi:hypothetical protein